MEIKSFTGNDKFKFQITLDRHNARLKLNYCLLPDPPNFSLLSTFKLCLQKMSWSCRKVKNKFLERKFSHQKRCKRHEIKLFLSCPGLKRQSVPRVSSTTFVSCLLRKIKFIYLKNRARICRPFKEPRNRFPAWRACTTTSRQPARPHRLAESVHRNRFLASINVYKYGLWGTFGPSIFWITFFSLCTHVAMPWRCVPNEST